MAYVVDRVVICDAYQEPAKHYQLLSGGRSKLATGRRPSMRFLASAKDVKGGVSGVVGKEAGLFEDLLASTEQSNDFVNQLRDEVRVWREAGYPGTAMVTRRLLEWWFERDEERAKIYKRFFFCQQEAVETVIYLHEVQNRRKMPETGELLRYALKLATGTGKTVVMALFVTWSTLHKRKVSGSSLSTNFLVLVPNLTVRDRVSGQPRGDGLDPAGELNLYDAFETVPPEYRDEFQPNVLVRNWQGIPLENKREDWIGEGDVPIEEGRFIPQSVLRAMRRRAKQDPNAPIRRLLGGWRDLVVINDEAHHVYGEKRTKQGEDPAYIKWSRILERVSKAARLSLVLDLSATPWYGSGSPKPEGTLYEWLVSDFSVYDAFESGLVKVVRLPDPDEQGRVYLDLWDLVKGAKTKEEYISACKGAIASIYSSWKKDHDEWAGTFEGMRAGPAPVLLCVTSDATRAGWVFEHLTREYPLLRNPDDEDRTRWVTIPIDSKVFDADKGNEAVLREMVNTVGSRGKPGEGVRCIVSVNMLSEGWDVKSVTHILGLRAFGSPLLTEQIIGRGLRRTSYDILNQPIDERAEGGEETVDAFGIPFVGFPVEKRKRARTGKWGESLNWIEPDPKKAKYRVTVPNVRSWAVGVTESLADLVRVDDLPQIRINPRETPPEVHVRPVVGGAPEAVITLEEVRREWPVLRTAFLMAEELFQATNPGSAGDLGIGPTFDELLDVSRRYLDSRVVALEAGGRRSDVRDVGIYYWRRQAVDALDNAIRGAGTAGTEAVPILGNPEWLDSANLRRFQWSGIVAEGKRCHTNKVPCHTDLEKQFADFLDRATDVVRYFKNERLGFSVTYYESNRPRQYYPDFIVAARDASGREVMWLAETKGEIRPNTALKSEAARLWCEKMSGTKHGQWRYLFAQQKKLEAALAGGVKSLGELAESLIVAKPRPQLELIALDAARVKREAFKTLLPLYSLKAAAGYFGSAEVVEPEAWLEAEGIGRLDERMFVCRAVGRSMEPTIRDGDYVVFRARPSGTRQGKVVLAQYRGPADPETGGSFTVKRYSSEKKAADDGGWRHTRVVLSPTNPEYAPIVLGPDDAEHVEVIAEMVTALRGA
ncbi:DEAD/DEAH box helicase family protein [Candidatus Binatia bacterium]|nr:DEAD/DEAH box helicase family protein [Candidatus Binatia bacterium]